MTSGTQPAFGGTRHGRIGLHGQGSVDRLRRFIVVARVLRVCQSKHSNTKIE